MQDAIGIILVVLLAIAFGAAIVVWWWQRQIDSPVRKRKHDPPSVPPRRTLQHFERGYDYRMIIGYRQDAAGRWEEVEIYNYDHSQGDWPRGAQSIRSMSQEELDAYFQSLRVNGWQQIGEQDDRLPLMVYYRRPIDHPLKRK